VSVWCVIFLSGTLAYQAVSPATKTLQHQMHVPLSMVTADVAMISCLKQCSMPSVCVRTKTACLAS